MLSRRIILIAAICLVVSLAWSLSGTAAAQTAAGRAADTREAAMSSGKLTDDEFAARVDLAALGRLSIQHAQTLKTLDTFARQSMQLMTGRTTLNGRSALFSLLDISFRADEYAQANLIRIRNVPLRSDFADLKIIDAAEKRRILETGMVSHALLHREETEALLVELQQQAIWKSDAIGQLMDAHSMFEALSHPNMPMLRIIPPATHSENDHVWWTLDDVAAWTRQLERSGGKAPSEQLVAYGDRVGRLADVGAALLTMRDAWRKRDADAVNAQIQILTTVLPSITPDAYPPPYKRSLEVIYNRAFKLTIPGFAIYFIAFVMFVVAAYTRVAGLRIWGLRLLLLAVIVHTVAILVRWILVEKSVGNWFEAIPIKNQFESVLFSTWFGAIIGLVLEMRRGRSLFGAAAAFVGWLSMILLFSVPYFIRSIGEEIGQAAGVLMSYWLYIHVTLATASYALIGMSFCLGAWWVIKYLANRAQLRDIPNERLVSADASASYDNAMIGPGGGGALSFSGTLLRMMFLPARVQTAQEASKRTVSSAHEARGSDLKLESTKAFLATLDQCNLVVLQLAFWVLGLAIILGAVWADQSWGRPWAWDPKETFALVTWITYLVIIHVRMVTARKAMWTAVLSIIGFFIMLFNWIGVNFFLVGLHSYA